LQCSERAVLIKKRRDISPLATASASGV